MRKITWQEATAGAYDVIIVGSGFAGSILGKLMRDAGKRVLLLEAGAGEGPAYSQHLKYVRHYMNALAKTPNSPYPNSPNAPQPEVTDVEALTPKNIPSHKGYFVQMGPYPFESNYVRRLGGTSLHWFGSCPRMLPEDFAMKSLFDQAVDWPLTYDDLLPYYALAEETIGVSAEVEEQQYHGIHFESGYVYPMHRIPPTYLDQWITRGLAGKTLPGEQLSEIRSIPQGRNSIPNGNYQNGKGYKPHGAAGNPAVGQRCMGNSSCIPICPIQARYNSLKTLEQTSIDILTQTVVSRLIADPETGIIHKLLCKVWFDDQSTAHQDIELSAPWIVLAANAIENAVLLKASGLCSESGQLGRNLMDHPAILSWGLAPESIGAFRGPGLTSTLVNYRGGPQRREKAGFVLEIGNWGWSWPRNEPGDTTLSLIDDEHSFGRHLRQRLGSDVPRQIRLDMMTEQLPNALNRITIDDAWRDRLGNYRPVIHYNVDDYTQAGLVYGREVAQQIFSYLNIQDATQYNSTDPGYFTRNGQGYTWCGVGHAAGTHRMGTTSRNSVVDTTQRAWGHPNLYVIGCGSMPTLGTSNPTLTMTALTFKTASHILERDH